MTTITLQQAPSPYDKPILIKGAIQIFPPRSENFSGIVYFERRNDFLNYSRMLGAYSIALLGEADFMTKITPEGAPVYDEKGEQINIPVEGDKQFLPIEATLGLPFRGEK